jgi:hypothetical protein
MPSAQAILDSLARVANEAFWFAVAWHAATALVLALALQRRLQQRMLSWLLCAPLASVSAFACWSANPFNGSVFALLALLLALRARAAPREPVVIARGWPAIAGWLMIAFAWVYPHFLDTAQPALRYLYGAPLGLIPCPTLSLVIGLTLLTDAPAGAAAALIAAAAGLFYGVWGVLRLHVLLDVALIVGALALLARAASRRAAASRPNDSSATPPARSATLGSHL